MSSFSLKKHLKQTQRLSAIYDVLLLYGTLCHHAEGSGCSVMRLAKQASANESYKDNGAVIIFILNQSTNNTRAISKAMEINESEGGRFQTE